MSQSFKFGLALVAFAVLGGCSPDYSPDTYNANAVQQLNKAEPGIIVGFRQVSISAAGTVGAVTGGAAGGILGAQVGPNGTASALGAVGGGVVGSLLGTGIEHATSDTTGWEYIVQKPNGDLLSVTQREPQPIPLGQKVLVIGGAQARIIPDYSVAKEPPKDKPADKDKPAVASAPQPAAVVPPWAVVPMVPPSTTPIEPVAVGAAAAAAVTPGVPPIATTPLAAPVPVGAPTPIVPAAAPAPAPEPTPAAEPPADTAPAVQPAPAQ